jgi:hypothetical protein
LILIEPSFQLHSAMGVAPLSYLVGGGYAGKCSDTVGYECNSQLIPWTTHQITLPRRTQEVARSASTGVTRTIHLSSCHLTSVNHRIRHLWLPARHCQYSPPLVHVFVWAEPKAPVAVVSSQPLSASDLITIQTTGRGLARGPGPDLPRILGIKQPAARRGRFPTFPPKHRELALQDCDCDPGHIEKIHGHTAKSS